MCADKRSYYQVRKRVKIMKEILKSDESDSDYINGVSNASKPFCIGGQARATRALSQPSVVEPFFECANISSSDGNNSGETSNNYGEGAREDEFGGNDGSSSEEEHINEVSFGSSVAKGIQQLDKNYLNPVRTHCNLKYELAYWSVAHKIPQAAVTELLKIIKRTHPEEDLPSDARSLLRTPRTIALSVESIGTEMTDNFIYFGMESTLRDMINDPSLNGEIPDCLNLAFNVDGIPLGKSTSLSFWPILCHVVNLQSSPFPIAIFCGKAKPPIGEYFVKFVNEVKSLTENGILISDKLIPVQISYFSCDAPARAYVKQTKTHGGYFSCDRCLTKGVYLHHSVSYPEVNAQKRTDESFRNRTQIEHHIGNSPLETLGIDMVEQFVIDPMHCVYLGVTRKLLYIWCFTVPYKLSVHQKKNVNDNIKAVSCNISREFTRKPRSLIELERFKATELRSFLLYYGAIVMRNELKIEHFRHFCLLTFAIRIYCSPNLVSDAHYLELAQKLILKFVKQFPKYYTNSNVVYNIHLLQHIIDDIKKWGSMDSYSAFCFENTLGSIKKFLRSGKLPLQQIACRTEEQKRFFYPKKPTNKIYANLEKSFILNDCVVDPSDEKNNAVCLKSRYI